MITPEPGDEVIVEFSSDVSCSSGCWGGVDAGWLVFDEVPVTTSVEPVWVGFVVVPGVVGMFEFVPVAAVPVAVVPVVVVPVAALVEPGWVVTVARTFADDTLLPLGGGVAAILVPVTLICALLPFNAVAGNVPGTLLGWVASETFEGCALDTFTGVSITCCAVLLFVMAVSCDGSPLLLLCSELGVTVTGCDCNCPNELLS